MFLRPLLVFPLLLYSVIARADVDADMRPEPAGPAVLKLFQKYQVVGLSDFHGCAELLAFIEQLVQLPEFAACVNDITWEPGNTRHQTLMDDFVLHGKDVPYAQLCRCWRDNTQTNLYGDTPALYHLLQTIREVNAERSATARVRVLLIDPPVDWARIRSKADIRPEDFDRESHMVKVLEREVYGKHRRALFFAGGAHLNRSPIPDVQTLPAASGPNKDLPRPGEKPQRIPFGGKVSPQNLQDGKPAPRGRILYGPLQTLERNHPGTTFTIGLHEGFAAPTAELEARLDSWPKPGFALLKSTWMGNLSPAPSGDIMIGPDGNRVVPREVRLQDRWDAILFLGRRAALTRVAEPGEDTFDQTWLSELKRRHSVVGTPPKIERIELPR